MTREKQGSQTNVGIVVLSSILSATVSFVTAYYLYNKKQKLNQPNDNTTFDNSKKTEIPTGLQNCPYRKEIEVAVELAIQCGTNMYKYCDTKGTSAEEDLIIETKGQAEDFCTQIDVLNETIVTDRIKNEFPSHAIIGEETVGSGPIPKLDPTTPTWIIDPIDGTTNFASGLPLTCVSIGYCVNQIPTMGVIYAPVTRELYIAVKGYGAYRNGIRITERNTPNKTIKESVVCFEFGYTRDFVGIDKMVGVVRTIMKNGCRTCRSLGSGVLDLVYVATGRIDIVYAGVAGEGWKPWDYCAASVVVQECNCSIQSFDQQPNDPFDIFSNSIICAVNPSLVSEMRALIRSS